ncbi:MAG: cytochrome c oxidase subunit CcoM [Pseudomonas sp.]
MFIDTVVVAGVGTVLLMLAFFAGFSYVIWKDANKPKKG